MRFLCGLAVLIVLQSQSTLFAEDVATIQKELNKIGLVYPSEPYESATNMLQKARLLVASSSDLFYKDSVMFVVYARLFWVHEKEGKHPEANIAYEKARYWMVVSMETRGFNLREIDLSLSKFTKDECRNYVEKLHKDIGPRQIAPANSTTK